MKKDTLFNQPLTKSFEFDESVASVFDDMLSRSVPFYKEVQKLTVDLILQNTKEGDTITDLGCSTASTLLAISTAKTHRTLKGIDNSPAMLARAQRKVSAYGADIELIESDLIEDALPLSHAFISHYTLQFIRPLKREEFIQKISSSLHENGIFIFSEKVISEDKTLNKQLIEIYYDYKKEQGYSELEIMQKREALENVLIPYTEEENKQMLLNNGFSSCESVFKWANFVTFVAKV